jgi:hypothetical protein
MWSNAPSSIPDLILPVDSVFHDSSGRKHICFGSYSGLNLIEFIEGVGCARGPMYQRFCWDFLRPRMMCASKDGRYTYQHPTLPTTVRWCDTLGDTVAVPASVIHPSSAGQVVLSPNPASSSLTLSGIDPAHYGSRYQIRNVVGQIVQQGTLPTSSSHLIKTDQLPEGLYYLSLPLASLPFLKR